MCRSRLKTKIITVRLYAWLNDRAGFPADPAMPAVLHL